ncbi:MAG: response regulator [Bacteroidetes bacterium]|nr:response regulator [Bacteroidota bacterium]
MLIDDNEIDNFINKKLLEAENFSEKILVYTSSISALEFFKNIRSNNGLPGELFPDMMFLDINMPIIDGFQFLEEYERINKNYKSDCKIVILTTSINPKDVEQSQENKHVVQFVNKPLTSELLSELKLQTKTQPA